ncbi:MAG: hypothetical protein KY455_11680 [Euryarchaeota archaeon]|nr:hypothetical protein [Euryarchaeota archaeon]
MPSHGRTLSVEDIAERLTVAGLLPDEARVLVWLWSDGPAGAGHVARALGLNRTRVYRILSDLDDRGYVSAEGRQPTRFHAAALDTVLADLIEHGRSVVTALERLRDRLQETSKLAGAATPPRATVRRVSGHNDVWLFATRLVREARDRLVLVDTQRAETGGMARMDLWVEAASRLRAGVALDVVLAPDAPTPPELTSMAASDRVRVHVASGLPPIRLLVADEREALVWTVQDDGAEGREEAVLGDDPGFVTAQLLCFRSLAERAAPACEPVGRTVTP